MQIKGKLSGLADKGDKAIVCSNKKRGKTVYTAYLFFISFIR